MATETNTDALGVTPNGKNSFEVKLSERDLDTLMFLSNAWKVKQHVIDGKDMAEYQHSEQDAAETINRTLEVLLEGVRRSGSWERNLAEIAFNEFDDLRHTAHFEFLEEQQNQLQERWNELDDKAGVAKDSENNEEFQKLLAEIETLEKQMDGMKLQVGMAEKLTKNPGLY